jgi:hypothetical protein
VNDEYYTPFWVWDEIHKFIPKGVVWEPFRGNGQSARYLRDLGHEVICEDKDFFSSREKGDVVVTNPPFSRIKDVLSRLIEWKKPFILLMPMSRLSVSYFKTVMGDEIDHFRLVLPSRRIDFDRPDGNQSKCPFDCGFYCYRIPTLKKGASIRWL